MSLLCLLGIATLLCSRTLAHTVITYPGWRGDNLVTNGTLTQYDPQVGGTGFENGQLTFPFGQQWNYPCGGMPMSTNRSYWPISGGALAWQPGWFPGHSFATMYVNIGFNEAGEAAPRNFSHNVVKPFEIVGPTNVQYNGTICLDHVPLPANVTFKVGDNITIQLIELAQHGASIYNCADVTLVDAADALAVSDTCFNSSDIGFRNVYTTTSDGTGRSTTLVIALGFISIFAAFAAFGF